MTVASPYVTRCGCVVEAQSGFHAQEWDTSTEVPELLDLEKSNLTQSCPFL